MEGEEKVNIYVVYQVGMNVLKKNIVGKDIRRIRMKWEILLVYIGWVNEVFIYKGIFKQKREESKGIGYEDVCEKLF